jgi:hypothetical protein
LADHARIDFKMTAITGADANSVDIPVHTLHKSLNTIGSSPGAGEAEIGTDGWGKEAYSVEPDVLVHVQATT